MTITSIKKFGEKIMDSKYIIGIIAIVIIAVIAGAVKGDIDVKGPVILDASAIVMGNIKSKSVQINNGAVIEVARGNKGIVLVNFSTKEEKFKVATTLADGEYTDKVSGNTIKVKNGEIKGKIAPLATYVIY